MTLRIERSSDDYRTTLRLIGRVQAEHLDELQAQIRQGGLRVALDLEEVQLVDVEVIRFLGTCQAAGSWSWRIPSLSQALPFVI